MTNVSPEPPQDHLVPFVLPGPAAERETLEGWTRWRQTRHAFVPAPRLDLATYRTMSPRRRMLHDLHRVATHANLAFQETPMSTTVARLMRSRIQNNALKHNPATRAGLMISGGGYQGKTETACEVAASFEDQWLDLHRNLNPEAVPGTRDLHVPVAYVQTPVTATPKSTCQAILDFYGADHGKMTLPQLVHAVRASLHDHGTHVLLLDDITRLRMHRADDQDVLDLIRALMSMHVTLVLIGVDIPDRDSFGKAATTRSSPRRRTARAMRPPPRPSVASIWSTSTPSGTTPPPASRRGSLTSPASKSSCGSSKLSPACSLTTACRSTCSAARTASSACWSAWWRTAACRPLTPARNASRSTCSTASRSTSATSLVGTPPPARSRAFHPHRPRRASRAEGGHATRCSMTDTGREPQPGPERRGCTVTTPRRPLPRSLEPLADESFPGYLLRLAHRLDLSPARLAAITGLTAHAAVPVSRMLALEPATAEEFGRMTRLSAAEVTALTLASLSRSYPPLDLAFSGRLQGVFVKENWVFSHASRYCPRCLAGDGSGIQRQHGGAWSKFWRLPVVFACSVHGQLLRHACPACDDPAQSSAGSGSMLPLVGNSTLHPTQCHNAVVASLRRACGHQLAEPAPTPAPSNERQNLLGLQSRLLALLRSDGQEAIVCFGRETTPARYFVDLRILTCVIVASWPAGRDLAQVWASERLIDRHVRRRRGEIEAIRRSGRTVREIGLYDRPPLESATCGHLLALGNQITATPDPEVAGRLLQPLLGAASLVHPWAQQFLTGGYCSEGLWAAVQMALVRPTEIKPALQPAPRRVRFGPQHIAQHLLPEQVAEHLADFSDIPERRMRRAAAAKLAQICLGGPAAVAADQLGTPLLASRYALRTVDGQSRTRGRRAAFDTGVDVLAHDLDTTPIRTDFGRRRDALKAWSLSVEDWQDLIDGLPEQPMGGVVRSHTHWGEGKRLLASVWIWTTITQGDHIYAPAVRPVLAGRRPGGWLGHYIHHRWRFMAAGRDGHYEALRERLDPYANRLAARIDAGLACPAGGPCGPSAFVD